MPKIITRLLPLLLLQFLAGGVTAQQRDLLPSLTIGDAVVTGFSGSLAPDASKPLPANKSAIDLTFIDPEGPSARIVGLGRPGYVWDGRLFDAPKTFDVLAKDVGQVFGIALDDQNPPNIYLAATSLFGLNIVSRGRDGRPERRKLGGPGAGWMKGQFGLDLQGGPGAIYKVDGRTGIATLFANVTLDGVPNPGPGLGNLAYDAAHKQLFVSDLYTGMIHRFDLDGKELSHFDHGVTALGAAKLTPVPFNSRNRPNIATARFDSGKPDSWGFAPAARRVFGLAVHEGRLYYSVVSGPQIWSVGITRDGDFSDNPRWELDVPAQAGPLPVSDIAFSHEGTMILAQRALVAGAYDYSAFTRPGEPQVFRIWLKGPNDPPSPGRWKLVPEEYPVGYAGTYRNTNGGVAFGYGYGADGTLNTTACDASLWITGQNLRNNPALRSQLEPGGPLVVHGLQGMSVNLLREADKPPAASYFVDYDGKFDDPRASGHIGSVRIYSKPCAPAAYERLVAAAAIAPIAMRIGCVGPNCRNVCTPTCICPPGTALKGTECVKQECSGGQVFNPAIGACACPTGMTLVNQRCVPIHEAPKADIICPPPMVQITGGACICPQGYVMVNGTCTPQPHECKPPLVADPVTGACECPHGGMLQNGQCVPQICPAPLVPGPCECPQGTRNEDGICVPVKKVDLGIEKTGATTPVQEPFYVFDIAVTNHGDALPANTVTVMDTVPSNMTFNSIGGGPWHCVPPSGGAGTVITCTYTLPVAATQALPIIHVNATATGKPPYPPVTECATVGTATGSGYVDTNAGNNQACVTVSKQDSKMTVTKTVAPDPRGLGVAMIFPMTVTCTNPNHVYPLSVHGNTSVLPFNVPVGSHCTVTETFPALPKGCTWLTPVITPAGVTIAAGGLNQVMVKNGYRCGEDNGSLVVKKEVKSNSPIALPAMTFPVAVNCGGTVTNLNLASNGTPQTVSNIPLNTSCTVQEGSVTTPPNVCPPNRNPAWTTSYSPASPVTVTGPGTTMTIQNVLDCERGGNVAVQKVIENRTQASLSGFNFPATLTCGTLHPTVTLTLPGPQLVHNITVGTVCSVVETQPAAPTSGCPAGSVPTWMPPSYSPASTTVVAGSGALLNVLNILYCKPQEIIAPQSTCDPRSTIARDNMCACRFENMEHASATVCMCKTGKLEPGKGCVTPTVCPPPKVPGPTPGSCICGPGYRARDDSCVKVLSCGEHSRSNRAGTSCLCNSGYVKKGDMCVRRTKEKREEPQIRGRDVIRGIELIPGLGGGGHGSGGGGGGQAPTPGRR